jgi:hypothetical protein
MGRNERRMPAQVILQPNFNRNQRKITLLNLPRPGLVGEFPPALRHRWCSGEAAEGRSPLFEAA